MFKVKKLGKCSSKQFQYFWRLKLFFYKKWVWFSKKIK